MKKEWFAAKELVRIAGLPSTPQAINQRAKKEEWLRQRRQGIQGGRAVEYHISSLPRDAASVLLAQEVPLSDERDTDAYVSISHSEKAWLAIYHQLTEYERNALITFVLREGINSLLNKVEIKKRASPTKNGPL